MTNNIGITAQAPTRACADKHCAFHGKIALRGRQFTGTITKLNSQRTATVEWQRLFYLPKYQRYEKRRSKLQVHHPDCIDITLGDNVRFIECRPISKTKNFIIIEKIQP
ncbi:MAG TPA: 30S ribosomal protein S17 [Candidatus Nanoarchaeia archaeon]|nr:30S ribosomal protein S17P [uncultured archaeon]HZX12320.1 30S ribosomal protein S17 [Candidatus Nanoarchaeia archaeon]